MIQLRLGSKSVRMAKFAEPIIAKISQPNERNFDVSVPAPIQLRDTGLGQPVIARRMW